MSSTIVRSNRIKCKLTASKEGTASVQVQVVDRTAFLDAVSKFIIYMSSFEMDSYIWCLDDVEQAKLSAERIQSFISIVDDIPYDLSGVSNEVFEEIKSARLELSSLLDRSYNCVYEYDFNLTPELDDIPVLLTELESHRKHKGFYSIPRSPEKTIERLGISYFSFIALDSFALMRNNLEYYDEWKWVR